MKKINVVGTSGSGKSTLARMLAQSLNLPYVQMDQVFWRPHWQQPSDEEFFADLEKALPPSGWVLDGNYTRTIPIKWRDVDTVVWIDLPFWPNFYQSLKRSLARAWTGEELWPNTSNCESFRKLFFSRDSILWWMITNHAKNRRKYEALAQDERYSHIHFIRLRSRRELREFAQFMTPQSAADKDCGTSKS